MVGGAMVGDDLAMWNIFRILLCTNMEARYKHAEREEQIFISWFSGLLLFQLKKNVIRWRSASADRVLFYWNTQTQAYSNLLAWIRRRSTDAWHRFLTCLMSTNPIHNNNDAGSASLCSTCHNF